MINFRSSRPIALASDQNKSSLSSIQKVLRNLKGGNRTNRRLGTQVSEGSHPVWPTFSRGLLVRVAPQVEPPSQTVPERIQPNLLYSRNMGSEATPSSQSTSAKLRRPVRCCQEDPAGLLPSLPLQVNSSAWRDCSTSVNMRRRPY